MSAIFGIIDLEDRPLDTKWIKSMQSNLAHRGPDGQRVYREESICFGHMLLQITPESVYDTSPYEEEGFVITAHARLDERERIMNRLNTPEVEREIITDPILLLRSFLKFGKGFVKDIYGDFAFAIWNKEKKELFCARDQMGVNPFLYYFEDNKFVFSTELKALVKLPIVKTEVDHIYNRNKAIYVDIDADKTPWRNITRLRPANSLLVQKSKAETKQYWNPKYKPNYKYKSEEKAADKLRELLKLAVIDRMRVIGGIGVPLSGGLDSTGIACLAARECKRVGKRITSASSVLDPNFNQNDVEDELSYINEVLNQEKNIEATFVYNSEFGFLQNLNEKFERLYDQVNYFHYVDEAIYKKFQSKSVRRILSGYLGDDFVTTSIKPLPNLFLEGRFKTFFKLSAKIKRDRNLSLFPFLKIHILEPVLPIFLRNLLARIKGHIPFLDIEALPILLNDQEKKKLKEKAKIADRNYYKFRKNIFHSAWSKTWNQFTEDWECGSSHYQIEMTYPLADRRVVEFILGLPIEHFSAGGQRRGLIRKALFDIFPNKIRDRQTKGKYSPAEHPIFQKDIDKIKAKLNSIEGKEKFGNIIDIENFNNYLDIFSKSKNNSNFAVDCYSIYALCIWLYYISWTLNKTTFSYEKDSEKTLE